MGDAIDKLKTGAIKVVGSVGDVMGAAGDITSSTANTASQLVDVTGKTAVGVTSNTGKALTAAAGTAAKTVETVENLSARLENYTKEAQKQAQIENETATFETQNANDVEKAKIEADRQNKIQKIQFDLEREQKKTEAEQKRLLADLSASQTQSYLDTQDNISKQQKAYYYGFTKNNPGSNDTGFKKSNMPFSKWCFSYIPKTFIKTDNTGVIDIIFPEQIPTGTRVYFINAINRNTGQPITISFKSKNNNWLGRNYRTEVPVIKYKDEQNNDVELEGTIDYQQIWFICPTTNRGGRRRRTNKNKHTNRRHGRTNRRKTNKRSIRRR